MTKKDILKVEEIVKRILDDMIYEVIEEEPASVQGYNDTKETFPVEILDRIEAFLGHSVEFMGIS